MAETRVTMPQLGESVHEGTISRWLVQPGDRVEEFEPMLEVDTDKVNAEVPSPVSGVLKEIIAREGETVAAGAEIAVVDVEAPGGKGEAGRPPDGEVRGRAPAAPPAGQEASGAAAGAGMEAGHPGAPPEREAAPVAAAAPPAPAEAPPSRAAERVPRGEEARPAATPSPAPAEPEPRGYSPAVLMLAQEHGVDLRQVPGTGMGGRVTRKDVERFVASREGRVAPGPAPTRAASAPATPREGDEAVPLTRVRRLIAENMALSKSTIPHAWQTQEADMSGVVANRRRNRARFQEQEGFSLTYLPYVIKAAASALRSHPEVNATFNQTEVLVHRDVNIGVSVGLEDTLVVPVIRRADSLTVAGIARAVRDLADAARTRRLTADDLQGATFTVNNSGTFGTLFSYSVISPGQAGILTMEAIQERPVAVNGMIGTKPLMYLCFSFDHRVLDGLQAARFLTACRTWLESVTEETPIY